MQGPASYYFTNCQGFRWRHPSPGDRLDNEELALDKYFRPLLFSDIPKSALHSN